MSGCNGFGENISLINESFLENSDVKYYYIDHFYTKSLEEFVDKIKRGSAVHGENKEFQLFRIIRYFNINKLKYLNYKYIIDNLDIKFQ